MDFATQGLMAGYIDGFFDPMQPWFRVTSKKDLRLFPKRGGGRRMRHPFLAPIVYQHLPDRTTNFGYDVLARIPSTSVKTLGSNAVAKFPEYDPDIRITETWFANDLSTLTEMFHQFKKYWDTPLQPGQYIGWQPKDASPKSYSIDILDVTCGPAEGFVIEELGDERPYFMREQLSVTFKLVREVQNPSGVAVAIGY